MRYYIIQRLGWEYNDEIYYVSEVGGGTPKKVYTDEEKAQNECDKLNAKYLSGLEIM